VGSLVARRSAMNGNVSAVERAFQIAKSGGVRDVREIRALLSREGFVTVHLDGAPMLARQLREAIKTTRESRVIAGCERH
jgi:hypothetical protein